MSGQKQQRWTGLRGKPESASMRFLLEQGKHRFPGPGYNTFHDRCLKEQNGYQRLIRSKINTLFASDEPELVEDRSYEGVGRGGGGVRGLDYAEATTPRPTSVSHLNTKPLLHLPRAPGASSHGGGGAGVGKLSSLRRREDNALNFPTVHRPSSAAGATNVANGQSSSRSRARGGGGAPDEPVLLEPTRMSNLTELNAKRLEAIWPQVARGWNSRNVQQTLYHQGRDNDESPLRTKRGCSCTPVPGAASTSASAAAGGAAASSSSQQNQQQQNQQQNSGDDETASSGRGTPAHSSHSSSYYAKGQSSFAYNRRVRAPAIPEPFLGRRNTARIQGESTTVLLRKLNDLEEEIRNQQGQRAGMSEKIREIKNLLLTPGPPECASDEFVRDHDVDATVRSIGSARNRANFPPNTHESRNVSFAN